MVLEKVYVPPRAYCSTVVTQDTVLDSDWESMHKFILEEGVPELLDKRVNQTNMRQYLEENPDVVPMGLNVDSEYTLSVRKK